MLKSNLKRVYTNEGETILHYDEEMLKDNLVFEETTIYKKDNTVSDRISLKYFNDIDAIHFTLYEGDVLAPIQTLRILSDIATLYQENSLKVFLEIIGDLYIASHSLMIKQ